MPEPKFSLSHVFLALTAFCLAIGGIRFSVQVCRGSSSGITIVAIAIWTANSLAFAALNVASFSEQDGYSTDANRFRVIALLLWLLSMGMLYGLR